MKLKFKKLGFQTDAVNAVVDVFLVSSLKITESGN